MPSMLNEINKSVEFLKNKGVNSPVIGVSLGTGLGKSFVDQITDQIVVDYKSIPHFPEATVESHHGRLIFGNLKGKKVLVMQGRFHYYEGHSMQQITFPVRVMKNHGVKNILIYNAAGNLNMSWTKGELMLLDDHINLQIDNPLGGKNYDELGPRFPDMSQPYSKALNDKLIAIATANNIKLNVGVYVGVTGPNLETRAEYRFLQRIGADAVGMSTVPEVIVANHTQLPCCAVSVLTDDCDPDNLKPAKLSDIIAVAQSAEPKLTQLFVQFIESI
jgi:purine-nucleoside phosphorylase